MQPLTPSEYADLTQGARVITREYLGGTRPSDKVLQLADGSYLKLFRLKHLLTSARLRPPNRRFQRNAARLSAMGIPTVTVMATYRLVKQGRTAVRYRPLEGCPLRTCQPPGDFDAPLAEALGVFVARLHHQGVHFRSLHFGNILHLPDGGFGLVDIADMRFYHKPLGWRHRRRNLRHLLRKETDRNLLAPWRDDFKRGYFQSAGLSTPQPRRLAAYMDQHLPPALLHSSAP